MSYWKSPQAIFHSLVDLTPALLGAAAGGYLFLRLDLPAPWISGGMLGAMLTALARPLPEMHPRLRDVGLLLAGVSMGSGVTPETVALMGKAPLSFVILAVAVIATIWLSSLWLSRMHGWSREDAMLAAAPGALSTVLAIGAARGGDVMGIAVVQTTRLFILIALLPSLVGWIEGPHPSAMTTMPVMSWGVLALMVLGGAALGLLMMAAKLAAGMMLGGALFGAALHGAGIVHGATPAPIAIAGFLLIGVMIATRTRGITWRSARDYAAASAASFFIAVVVGALLAALASWLLNIRLGATLLAFAPGGVEAMTLLSMSLALDPLYVAAHHIARFMGIGLCIPLWFRLADRAPRNSS